MSWVMERVEWLKGADPVGFYVRKNSWLYFMLLLKCDGVSGALKKSLIGNLVWFEDGPAAVTGNRFHVLPLGASPGKVWKMVDPEVRRPAWNDGTCNPVEKDANIDTRNNRDSPDQLYDSGIFLFSGSGNFSIECPLCRNL